MNEDSNQINNGSLVDLAPQVDHESELLASHEKMLKESGYKRLVDGRVVKENEAV